MNTPAVVVRVRKLLFFTSVLGLLFAPSCLMFTTNAWLPFSSPPTATDKKQKRSSCSGKGLKLDAAFDLQRGTILRHISRILSATASNENDAVDKREQNESEEVKPSGLSISTTRRSSYDLGLGKNKPLVASSPSPSSSSNTTTTYEGANDAVKNWIAPDSVDKTLKRDVPPTSTMSPSQISTVVAAAATAAAKPITTRRMVAINEESQHMRAALWHEGHYSTHSDASAAAVPSSVGSMASSSSNSNEPPRPAVVYPDLDLSIPDTVYCEEKNIDIVWDTIRWEAYQEAQREPLLVSFLYSTILNHPSLESSLAFLLANRLSSPMMISTQLQSLILNALECSPDFRRSLRADMFAVRDRDPACTCLPDVFLYFKGFQALQAHRVAHFMWKRGKRLVSHYLQSQVSQIFQIDIHPNATLKSGIMLDHGTGIVIGETATVGYNCSILHHVTLGGSGKKGVDRHPKVHDGVLLGAGATVLGNVQIGEGCQIGAGTLVISDLQPHCVAVGVPAKIIGSFVDVTEQPSIGMDQMMSDLDERILFQSGGI